MRKRSRVYFYNRQQRVLKSKAEYTLMDGTKVTQRLSRNEKNICINMTKEWDFYVMPEINNYARTNKRPIL